MGWGTNLLTYYTFHSLQIRETTNGCSGSNGKALYVSFKKFDSNERDDTNLLTYYTFDSLKIRANQMTAHGLTARNLQ